MLDKGIRRDVAGYARLRIVRRRDRPFEHGRLGWTVGCSNPFENVLQFSGIMTEETVPPDATGQVIPMTEPRAGRRDVVGVSAVEVDDIFRVFQPPFRMMRKTDLTIRTVVAGKTAYP